MANMIPISTVTVGSGGVATISFTGIPQTYSDLRVVISARSTDNSSTVNMSINGSSSNLTRRTLYGSPSVGTATSDTASNLAVYGMMVLTSYTSSTFSNGEVYIPNYTSSNYKSISIDTTVENNAATSLPAIVAGLWSSTAAITSLTFTPNAGNFDQYTTATLYGIRKY